MSTNAGFHLTNAEFNALADRLSNWGRWGSDDEAGTLNFITPETRLAATRLVKDGRTVSCSLNLPTMPAPDSPRPFRHLVYRGPDDNMGASGDYIAMEPHGWSTTHLDALCHFYFRGRGYNDRPLTTIQNSGATVNTIMTARAGIVARGVLIDLPRAMGKDWLEPGEAAPYSAARKAIADARLTLASGDVVLVRTGRPGRNAAKGTPEMAAGLAGLSVEAAEWIHDSEVASLISDGGMDSQPSEVDGVRVPWHVLTLVMMGMVITDNADLEELARTCSRLGRWEFLLAMAPLRLAGGTSSPVNPIAVF